MGLVVFMATTRTIMAAIDTTLSWKSPVRGTNETWTAVAIKAAAVSAGILMVAHWLPITGQTATVVLWYLCCTFSPR